MLITIQSFTLPAENLADGNSYQLRLWYNQGFLDSSGQAVAPGTGTTGTYLTADATVSGGFITFDPFTVYSTLDAEAPQPQSIQISSQLYKGNTALPVRPFNQTGTPSQWIVPDDLGATISFEEWTLRNQAIQLYYFQPNWYTAAQVDALIAAAVSQEAINQDYIIGDYASFAAAITAITPTGGTLVINEATTATQDVAVPSIITLRFTRKGSLTITSTKTVTIAGPIEADAVQIFFNATAGLGAVSFAGNPYMPVLLPEWWGALADDATDCKAAIQAAVTAVPTTGGTVQWGIGTYVTQSEVLVARGNITLQGAGQASTKWRFAPSGAGNCLKVQAVADQVRKFTIDGFTFHSDNASLQKTAIYVTDLTNNCRISNITIQGPNIDVAGNPVVTATAPMWHSTAQDSIGIHTHGRDLTTVENVNIWADAPVKISANPNTSATDNEDMDQWNWNNCYLIALGNYCVKVDDGLGIQNVSFTGRQSWAGGLGGFKMNDTRISPNVSTQGVTFENIRIEQQANADLTQPSTGYGFLVSTVGAVDMSFKNIEVGFNSNGWSVTGVYQVNYESCVGAQGAGQTSLIMTPQGGGADTVAMQNCSWQLASTFTMTSYVLAAGNFNATNYAGPNNAVYTDVAQPYAIGLEVSGGPPSAALHVFKNIDGGAQLILQNPNVGASAEARLRVIADSAESAFICESVANGNTVQWQGTTNVGLVINQVSAAPMTFQTTNIERMRIGAAGEVTVAGPFNYSADTAVTDAYTVAVTPAPAAYTTGMLVVFKAATANTGACTLQVNALAAIALKRGVATDPTNDFIKIGSIVVAIFDGTNFQMIQPAAQ